MLTLIMWNLSETKNYKIHCKESLVMNYKIFLVLAAIVFCSVTISLADNQGELGNPILYPPNNLNDPLIKAAFVGDLAAVKEAIASGSDINVTNDEGITALCFASLRGYTKIVGTLLAAGADVNKIEKKHGWAPLYIAALKGHVKIIKALLAAGADVNITNNEGWTALYIASSKGHIKVVKGLLTAGADVNITNNDGETVLLKASWEGHTKIVELLLAAGADVNIKTKINGWSVLYIAQSKGHTKITELLKAYGAKE